MNTGSIFARMGARPRGAGRGASVWVAGMLVVIALSGTRLAAGTVVTSLTEGRYRAGRFIPVRVQRDNTGNAVTLDAPGMLPTTLDAGGERLEVIVPWLALSETAAEQSSPLLTTPLRALADNERLIAYAGTRPGEAQALFPGKTIVPVTLDPRQPLLEPAAAWECLDAVILSPAAAARLDGAHRATLLAAGTTLAVQAQARPDDAWPWKRVADYWVLQVAPAGPDSLVEPDTYSPTYDWDRGWPARFRRAVFFAAVLYAILAGAVMLWRSRRMPLALIGLTSAFGIGFEWWYARQSAMLEFAAAVRVDDAGVSQFDLWTWFSPVRSAGGSFPAGGLTHPVLGSIRQAEQTGLRLNCDVDGRPQRFTFHLDPGQSLAMRSREVRLTPAASLPALASVPRSLRGFVESLYARPGDVIVGAYPVRAEESSRSVSVVVIRRIPK